jgi:hypothetical protein
MSLSTAGVGDAQENGCLEFDGIGSRLNLPPSSAKRFQCVNALSRALMADACCCASFFMRALGSWWSPHAAILVV